jgi:hypothetical protein
MHLVTSGVFMGVFRQRGPCPSSVNYLFLYFRLLVQGGCVSCCWCSPFISPSRPTREPRPGARVAVLPADRPAPPPAPQARSETSEVEKSAKHLSRVGSRDASTVEGSRAVSSGATSTAPCTAAASAAAASCRSNRKRERCSGCRACARDGARESQELCRGPCEARPPARRSEAAQRRRAYG